MTEMPRRGRPGRWLALVLGLWLAACAAGQEDAGPRLRLAAPDQALTALMAKRAAAVPPVAAERAMEALPGPDAGRIQVLALASSGPSSAYAAGFLKGWASQSQPGLRRPRRVDVVVGISGGALLATHAFLGDPASDQALEAAVPSLAGAALGRPYGQLAGLVAPSQRDPAPVRAELARLLTPALLDRVAAATELDPVTGQPGRFLLALALDLARGTPRVLDLGALARQPEPQRQAFYVAALMAASAIPVALPPVPVADGLLVDGGPGQLPRLVRYLDQLRGSAPAPQLTVILGETPAGGPVCAGAGPWAVAERSLALQTSWAAKAGLDQALALALANGVTLRWSSAAPAACRAAGSAAELRCLFAQGHAAASGAIDPWRTRPAATSDEPFTALTPAAGPACPAG